MSLDVIAGMEPLSRMEPLSPILSADAKKTNGVAGGNFSDILTEAIGRAAEAEAVDQSGMAALLTGEDIEAHTIMNQTTQAELTLNLAIQIRNKVVDAYTEIMRMSV
ncbi:MAG: flagellar hook-basal body complex protein FliE [Clostridiales bacterium]|jgi:flagellar hook-basal body complex protein FliE|nr:flagellar hook-basal body complex protein FliE [Clostridiales bacterium]